MTKATGVRTLLAPSSLASILFLASCSSSDPSSNGTARDDAPTPEVSEAHALAIGISAPPAADTYEVWSCLNEAGMPLGYTFHRDGTFGGAAANLLLGQEMASDVGPLPSDHLVYIWKTTSMSALTMTAPDKGVEIEWTDIVMHREGWLTASSSTRGSLWCQRSTIAQTDIGAPPGL